MTPFVSRARPASISSRRGSTTWRKRSGVPAPPTPSAASRSVLWRTHQCGSIASHRRPRGRDPLLRLHQSLPLGEQERPLPREAPGVHLRPRHRGPPSVLWFGQMYRAASPRLLLSRPALSHRGETDLPTVSDLRGKPAGPTPAR